MLKITDINVWIKHRQIINAVSLEVQPGAIVGLIGPNGAGKTTIMKTILGLMPFSGTVTIDNQSVTETNHTGLKSVGALIEHPALYPFLTGYQNLALYAQDEADLQAIVTQLEMTPYINRKAKGYSLGMKQKLGIALALLNHPQLVILDEPMNGLDIDATILVWQIIQQYAQQGTAFLIASHILSELEKVVTDVIIINNGQVRLNQPIATFNQVTAQRYRLQTTDMAQTLTLLTDHQIPFEQDAGYLNISQTVLYTAQTLCFDQQIQFKALIPEQISFEQRIVQLLHEKGGDEHAN